MNSRKFKKISNIMKRKSVRVYFLTLWLIRKNRKDFGKFILVTKGGFRL